MSDRTTDPPRSAADPRDGEPYYIESHCPECGTALVLFDDPAETPDDAIWHDEWICPHCCDGIRLDWPQRQLDELVARAAEADADPNAFVPLKTSSGSGRKD